MFPSPVGVANCPRVRFGEPNSGGHDVAGTRGDEPPTAGTADDAASIAARVCLANMDLREASAERDIVSSLQVCGAYKQKVGTRQKQL